MSSTTAFTSQSVDLIYPGETTTPEGWRVSHWNASQTSNMTWSTNNVRTTSSGAVEFVLCAAPKGSPRPYLGGEAQSVETASTGTWSWTVQAPKMVSGAVLGLFTYQADYRDPQIEFDFEFVGANTSQVRLNIHMEYVDASGQARKISLEEINGWKPIIVELGFDASQGLHTYDIVVSDTEAIFLVDGKVVGRFDAGDMGGVWTSGEMRGIADLWCVDRSLEFWAGAYSGQTVVATVSAMDVLPGAGLVIDGTTGDNVLVGTGIDDVLNGLEGNDTLLGRGGADTLDGGAGIDRLEGGTGNDIYILATSGDTVVEALDAGIDVVKAGYSYTLGANLENLVLTGTSAINGTGNSLANRITGNGAANVLKGLDGNDTLLGLDGNDRLTGGGGKDSLTGGMGDDAFQFNGTLDGGDFIMDFSNVSGNNDHFRISAAGFGGGLVAGTTLAASQFRARADNLAQDSDDRFIFRTTDQTLWFDSNGNASGGLTLVADLQAGAVMTSADILLVA
jgi:hypothetical protein